MTDHDAHHVRGSEKYPTAVRDVITRDWAHGLTREAVDLRLALTNELHAKHQNHPQ
jgi:hypothetical protein